jgi:hypothetical protein
LQTGLVMERELDMDDLVPADVEMIGTNIKRALALYGDKAALKKVQVAAMAAAKDYSWTKATKQYIDHFLVPPPPTRPRAPASCLAHPLAHAPRPPPLASRFHPLDARPPSTTHQRVLIPSVPPLQAIGAKSK